MPLAGSSGSSADLPGLAVSRTGGHPLLAPTSGCSASTLPLPAHLLQPSHTAKTCTSSVSLGLSLRDYHQQNKTKHCGGVLPVLFQRLSPRQADQIWKAAKCVIILLSRLKIQAVTSKGISFILLYTLSSQ